MVKNLPQTEVKNTSNYLLVFSLLLFLLPQLVFIDRNISLYSSMNNYTVNLISSDLITYESKENKTYYFKNNVITKNLSFSYNHIKYVLLDQRIPINLQHYNSRLQKSLTFARYKTHTALTINKIV